MKEIISKTNLLKALKLNEQILDLMPSGDSMYDFYDKMSIELKERHSTYEKFRNNPYSTEIGGGVKYNSDEQLELGDYFNISNK